MVLIFPFTVIRPQTVPQALKLLDSSGGRWQMIAGGTDLIPRLSKESGQPSTVMDLSPLGPELNYIRLDGGALAIGALATHDEIARSALVGEQAAVLAKACQVVGSQQIRNRGTIGGNLANASPAGDTLPALLALDASVRLARSSGSRIVPLDQFLVGPGQTILERDEIVCEIEIPAVSLVSGGGFTKLGLRNALAIAIASVAVVVDRENRCRVAYGSLAPRAVRARGLEDAINNRELDGRDSLRPYVLRAISPITDIRASDEYRRAVAVNLTYISLYEMGLTGGGG